MPELPEVETVRLTLANQIVGLSISDVTFYYPKLLENVTPLEFTKAVTGQVITRLDRYGKYLMLVLERQTIIIHLRMEGKFFYKKASDPIEKHEHVVFSLSNSQQLRFHDTRKFGRMALVNTTDLSEIRTYPALAKLGPEANIALEPDLLYAKMQVARQPIKTFLLDQSNLAGLGNIYVDEVCYRCHLHPALLTNQLMLDDARNIINASVSILNAAIEMGGTTIRSYTSSLGVTGRFQQSLCVHSRDKEHCLVCQTLIRKTRIGGRGTYFCPVCQKQKRLVIGITGGIASGKSAVSSYIRDVMHYPVIDCDQLAHDLLATDQATIERVKMAFTGTDIMTNDVIDRHKLGQIVFNDSQAKAKLEAIIHPAVREKVHKMLMAKADGIIFVDIPLLYEAHMGDMCDYVIVINCASEKQLERLQNRDQITADFAKQKIASQMPLAKKVKMADFVIDNSTSLVETYAQVENIIQKLKQYCQ